MKIAKRGFTLIEVLIALVFMVTTTTIMVGLLNSSMKALSIQKKITDNSTVKGSAVERAMGEANSIKFDASKSVSFKVSADAISSTDKIKIKSDGSDLIKGIIASYDETDTRGFSLTDSTSSSGDKINAQGYNTFISQASTSSSGIIEMGELYIDASKPFLYFPAYKASSELKLMGKFRNLSVSNDLKAIRYTWFLSPVYSEFNNLFIHRWLDEEASPADPYTYNKPILADYNISHTENYSDKDGMLKDSITYQVLPKPFKLGFKTDEFDKYLSVVDKDIMLGAQALSYKGYASGLKYSERINMQNNSQKFVHIIGLPYTRGLLNHQDANLIAKPITEDGVTKWYSLYGSKMTANVADPNSVINGKIKWRDVRAYYAGHFDVLGATQGTTNNTGFRQLTNSGDDAPLDIGFDFDRRRNNPPTSNDFLGELIQSSAGMCVKYKTTDQFRSTGTASNRDIFLKFKLQDDETNYTLLEYSNNFRLFIDNNALKFQNLSTTKTIVNDLTPYKQKFKTTVPGRDNYITMGIFLRSWKMWKIGVYLLRPEITDKSIVTKFDIFGFDSGSDLSYTSPAEPFIVTFGGVPSGETTTDKSIEITDFLYYTDNNNSNMTSSDDFAGGIQGFTPNYAKITMDYLFRKHLTDEERVRPGFIKEDGTDTLKPIGSFDERYILRYKLK